MSVGTRRSRRTILRRIFKPAWLYFLSRRLNPLSHNFGSNRGEPVDRYYIEKFLSNNAKLICGNILEIENDIYCLKFGDTSKCDVLDINKNNPKATIIADLINMPQVADNSYDCVILTQVFQFIDNCEAAIKECYRILKPGGVLLATLPFMSRIDGRAGMAGDYWRFTTASAKYLFGKYFNDLEIISWGNVLSGTAFWIGMAQEELSKKELEHNDSSFPVIISVKATK